MTFLEALRAHTGGLIRLKTDLFWYGCRGLDGSPGRICLILDASPRGDHSPEAITTSATLSAFAHSALASLLLIDSTPQWIWVAQEDVELL